MNLPYATRSLLAMNLRSIVTLRGEWITRMQAPLLFVALLSVAVSVALAGRQNSIGGTRKTMHSTGSFDVHMKPPGGDEKTFPRFTGDKQFHGDLEGTSYGEMLASGPPPSGPQGSSGYVAMESVTGKLGGRTGSFVLQHCVSINLGVQQQSITVVPQSGTDELAGLEGKMIIRNETSGKHFYDFDYTLPGK
jgi:hypothetical protein